MLQQGHNNIMTLLQHLSLLYLTQFSQIESATVSQLPMLPHILLTQM